MMDSGTPIYIVCPAHVATGGTEATHALCYELLKLGLKSVLFYINVNDSNTVVPARFKHFNAPYVLEVKDDAGAQMVIPENSTDMINQFPLMKKFVWWLSVDNYTRPFRFCGPRDMCCLLRDRMLKRNVDFNDGTLWHLCQSHYAFDFVKKMGGKNVHYLMDYLGEEHFNANVSCAGRQNVVLYNPSKGISFTRRIIKSSPAWIKFVPLCNMSPAEVHSWCRQAKVYIDFGNHPGKDRFPRESAMSGCVVITSKRGAAAFYEDVPIHDCYKFNDTRDEIPKIVNMISDCLEHYEARQSDFEGYRAFIREDYPRFVQQVKKIFLDRNFC